MTTVAAETISTGLEECESLEEIEFYQSKLTYTQRKRRDKIDKTIGILPMKIF